MRSPFFTSRSACSSSSAMCALTTMRQFLRSIVLPCLAAVSSAIFHCLASASGPPGRPAPIDSTPTPCLPGGDHAERRDRAGDRDLEMRIGVGREMQPRLVQLEPVGLHRDRLLAVQQPHDRVQRLQHARTLRAGFDAQHVGVRRQRARAAAQHGAAARHVVELHEALRHHERMVIRQAGHAGAEPDVLGALGGGGDEQFGQAISSQPAE